MERGKWSIAELKSYAEENLIPRLNISQIISDYIDRASIKPELFDLPALRNYIIEHRLRLPPPNATKDEYIRIIKEGIRPIRSPAIDLSSLLDDLLGKIFLKLRANDLYRLYQVSNRAKKIIDKQSFWREKLVVEGYHLPRFPVDWREWYLKVDDYPIAGVVYGNESSNVIKADIIQIVNYKLLDRRGQLHKMQRNHSHPLGELPLMRKYVVDDPGAQAWLDVDGRVVIKNKDAAVETLSTRRVKQILFNNKYVFFQYPDGEMHATRAGSIISKIAFVQPKPFSNLARIFVSRGGETILQDVDNRYYQFIPKTGGYQLLSEPPRAAITGKVVDGGFLIGDAGNEEEIFRMIPFRELNNQDITRYKKVVY